jgi:hypothetical protein
MKRLQITFFTLLFSTVFMTNFYGSDRDSDDGSSEAAAVPRHKIPDRPPADRKRPVCCGLLRRDNPKFKKDMARLHDILEALKVTNPETLQVLHVMCGENDIEVDDHILLQLNNLGFLNLVGHVKEGWREHILAKTNNWPLGVQEGALDPEGPPPQRVDVSLLGCLTCKSPHSEVFMNSLGDLNFMLQQLKVTSPDSLRELFLKSVSPLYVLSPHVQEQLERLGFLVHYPDRRGYQIRPIWLEHVLAMFVPRNEAQLEYLKYSVAMEDLSRRYPESADTILHRPSGIGAELRRLLMVDYSLIPTGLLTPTALTHMQEALRRAGPERFFTCLDVSDIAEVFLDFYGILVG